MDLQDVYLSPTHVIRQIMAGYSLIWLAQLVKALAATVHDRLWAGGLGSTPGVDKLDSGFHHSGVSKMRCS